MKKLFRVTYERKSTVELSTVIEIDPPNPHASAESLVRDYIMAALNVGQPIVWKRQTVEQPGGDVPNKYDLKIEEVDTGPQQDSSLDAPANI